MEILLIIGALVNIVILVIFIIIAKNVSKIASHFANSKQSWIFRADEEAFIGNKEKAKECYRRAKYLIDINYELPGTVKAKAMSEIDEKINAL